MKENGRHRAIISIIITFIIVSVFMVGIQYNRTISDMKSVLQKRALYTQELNSSLSKLYSITTSKWEKERINFTKLQSTMIAGAIQGTYKITGKKDIAQKVANYLVNVSFVFSENTYAYVMDNQTGKVIAHPITPDISPPPYIAEKIRSACPEGLTSYKWNKPGANIHQEKYAYIKCIPELDWAVGTSLYLEDIKNSMSVIKRYIAQAIDTLADPLEKYIEMAAYPKIPKELQTIPVNGSVVKIKHRYIAAVKSQLTGILYVYSISENTVIIKTLISSLPFLLVIMFLLIVVYITLKNQWEKEALISSLWNELMGVQKSGGLSQKELITLIKGKIEEIERALTIKEFVGELSSLISSSTTLSECLEYMYNYLKSPFKLNGIYIYMKKGEEAVPITHIGENKGIAITIPHLTDDRQYNISLYTKEPLNTLELEILGEILKSFFAKLEDISKQITDPLTGAYTRRFLEEYGEDFINPNTNSGVVMLDLDHFKEVNDTLGHQEGDRVLKEVVKRIESTVRPTDVVIRLGGDEFVILMRDISYKAMCYAAERIKQHIKEPPIVSTIEISASIGAVWKSKGVKISVDKILQLADKNMYQAKQQRDSIVCMEIEQ